MVMVRVSVRVQMRSGPWMPYTFFMAMSMSTVVDGHEVRVCVLPHREWTRRNGFPVRHLHRTSCDSLPARLLRSSTCKSMGNCRRRMHAEQHNQNQGHLHLTSFDFGN